ncbi:hypothetical protein LTR95_012073 [Oleoguttula sp. CCFEE 5521]
MHLANSPLEADRSGVLSCQGVRARTYALQRGCDVVPDRNLLFYILTQAVQSEIDDMKGIVAEQGAAMHHWRVDELRTAAFEDCLGDEVIRAVAFVSLHGRQGLLHNELDDTEAKLFGYTEKMAGCTARRFDLVPTSDYAINRHRDMSG